MLDFFSLLSLRKELLVQMPGPGHFSTMIQGLLSLHSL